ncbi:NAD(P)-dependent oxidoreductase [Agrococcus sp. Marseille-Q4369]|uniref:NAD(P)-dependent oxidoreductase n=1 Tax=Agrococcus sp. Marseille-Q4369 TaxID=2810513 RepID=UPI001B8C0335|nr:NAD(P)-dependent oxidoreductase [Agrococcus sp. Marseille-Q4369]QUW17852.1 NAD(P)-dependent oxidoreductase [Agrococcus sp. Marseille-Q4369]
MAISSSVLDRPIGVIGLGNMGLALARRLADSFTVLGSDPSGERQALAAAAGIEVVDQQAVARSCSVVLLSLPRPSISLAVTRALAAGDSTPSVIVETSTVNPSDIADLVGATRDAGIAVIDSAILSGVKQMSDGTSGLLIAGDRSVAEQLDPLFAAVTDNRRIVGESGSAMAAKVLNNAVAHVVMVLLGEALALSKTSGLDPQLLVDILTAPDGGLMRPLTHRIAERAFSGDYEGGMSLEAARKDSTLVLAMAQDAGVPVFTMPAAHGVYEMAMAAGFEREDYAALVKLWEAWCATSFVSIATP